MPHFNNHIFTETFLPRCRDATDWSPKDRLIRPPILISSAWRPHLPTVHTSSPPSHLPNTKSCPSIAVKIFSKFHREYPACRIIPYNIRVCTRQAKLVNLAMLAKYQDLTVQMLEHFWISKRNLRISLFFELIIKLWISF